MKRLNLSTKQASSVIRQNPVKKRPTGLNLITTETTFFKKQKLNSIASSYNEVSKQIQSKYGKSTFHTDINTKNHLKQNTNAISYKPRLSSQKISFARNSHSIVNSLTFFNANHYAKVKNSINQSKNNYTKKTVRNISINLSNINNKSIGASFRNKTLQTSGIVNNKGKAKNKINQSSINKLKIQIADSSAIAKTILTEPTEEPQTKRRSKPKNSTKGISKNDLLTKLTLPKDTGITERIDTNLKIPPLQKLTKKNNSPLKLNLLSLIQENKKYFVKDRIRQKCTKINLTNDIEKVLNDTGKVEPCKEFDNFDDLNSIIKRLDFSNMSKNNGIFSNENNKDYEEFCYDFDIAFKHAFSSIKYSESGITKSSRSTHENSSKKSHI